MRPWFPGSECARRPRQAEVVTSGDSRPPRGADGSQCGRHRLADPPTRQVLAEVPCRVRAARPGGTQSTHGHSDHRDPAQDMFTVVSSTDSGCARKVRVRGCCRQGGAGGIARCLTGAADGMALYHSKTALRSSIARLHSAMLPMPAAKGDVRAISTIPPTMASTGPRSRTSDLDAANSTGSDSTECGSSVVDDKRDGNERNSHCHASGSGECCAASS